MKLKLIFFCIVLNLTNVSAQSPITLGNNNMPKNGDTLRYTGIQLSSIGNFTQTGVNFNWNFSNVISTTEGLRSFRNGLQTPYFIFFGFSAFGEKIADTISLGPVNITNYYNYYRQQTNPNAFVADGAGITFSSVPLPSYYSDKDELYNFPMSYPKYDSTKFKFSTLTSNIVPVRYSKTGYRVTKVDGWGTITTPYGTQNCLRLITTQYAMDTLKTTIGPVTIPLGFQNFQRSYQWMTLTSKIPYLEVSGLVLAGIFLPNEAKYRGFAVPLSTTGLNQLKDKNATMLYPNPVKDKLSINTDIKSPVAIYSDQGQLVGLFPFEEGVIDVSPLAPGLYFLNTAPQSQKVWYKFVKQ